MWYGYCSLTMLVRLEWTLPWRCWTGTITQPSGCSCGTLLVSGMCSVISHMSVSVSRLVMWMHVVGGSWITIFSFGCDSYTTAGVQGVSHDLWMLSGCHGRLVIICVCKHELSLSCYHCFNYWLCFTMCPCRSRALWKHDKGEPRAPRRVLCPMSK